MEPLQPVAIRLLGDHSISGAAAGPASARSLELIAYLAVHAGARLPRQRIAGVLWPESTDAQALTNLRRELHLLRRLLGDGSAVVAAGRDLGWADGAGIRVDVRDFALARSAALAAREAGDPAAALRHAEAALATYAGDLLPGSYDDWVLDARAELHRWCVELCTMAAELHALRGDHEAALTAARRRVRLEPLEESGYRALMALQAESGDRAGAINTYHRCASLLEQELGVEPDATTQRAFQELLRSASRPEDAAAPPGLRPAAPAPRLVGRDLELQALGAQWNRAVAGRAGLVVVHGGAGVGKTALLTELASAAGRDGALVAFSRCFATGRLALAPIGDWLRQAEIGSAAASLAEPWRQEVERLAAVDGEGNGPVAGARAMIDGWQRHRFFEGLARALEGIGRPLFAVLDNIQWCDLETLGFVSFLLAFSPRAPLLIAATLRTGSGVDGPDRGLADWLAESRASGVMTEVMLGPLEADDTARLAGQLLGRALAPGQLDTLHAATGGFPLHIIEALRMAGDGDTNPLPLDNLGAVLAGRLAQPSAAARDVAGLAAAIGREFPLDLLAEASDLDADGVVAAVDELWRLGILHQRGAGYDFAHDLLRDAAYQQISPPRRWLLHRRVAQSLELLHRDRLDPVSAQLAAQHAQAGRPDRAIHYYRRAAVVASGVFAHAEAIRLNAEALTLVRSQPPSPDTDRQELSLLEAMASPLNARYGYSSQEVQTVLERAVELAERLGRTDQLISALVALHTTTFVQGRIPAAHEIGLRALELASAPAETGVAHFVLGGSALSLGRPQEAIEHFEIARGQPHGDYLSVGTQPEIHGLAWAAHAHWLVGEDDLALNHALTAIADARRLGHPYSLAVALAYGAATHQLLGDRVAVADLAGELAGLCHRHDFAYYREWAPILAGWATSGERGLADAQRAVENLRAAGSSTRMPYWLALTALILLELDRPAEALVTLDRAAAGAVAHADLWWLPEVHRLRAGLDTDGAVAVERLRGAARMARSHGSTALLRRCEADLATLG